MASTSGIVRTACSLCMNRCGLLAYVADGKILKLEGDPDNPHNHGHACAKGLSGHLSLYSDRRIRRPLLRTNSEKGRDVDPRWKEISWDEAIDLFAEKIRQLRDKPGGFTHKVLFANFDLWSTSRGPLAAWMQVMQTDQAPIAAACFCGNAVHTMCHLNMGVFEHTPDAEYAKYILLIGAQAGSIIHYDTMNTARYIAEKRPGSIKVVAVDPVCSYAASKAEEWVPIRPGTDTAFVLGLVNVLLNEEKVYDSEFLKRRTNSPYLVSKGGLYARGRDGKPLVWDSVDNKPRPFDAQTTDLALEGNYEVDGERCEPAFQKVKEFVKQYSPEHVSRITTVPEATTRRIAKELGEAASIGSTIDIDGTRLPYRPVSVVWYRGLSGHRHSFMNGMAALLLPTLLGAIRVPGAVTGTPPIPTHVTADGLLGTKPSFSSQLLGGPYPPRRVTAPKNLNLKELFPVAIYSTPMVIPALLEPSKYGLGQDSIPDLMLVFRNNPVANTFSPELVVEAFKKIPFIISFSLEPDETTDSVADLVFPDVHHLERMAESLYAHVAEPGYWYAAKPVVKPPFEGPYDEIVSMEQILYDVARRAGFLPEFYDTLNQTWGLTGTQYQLDVNSSYTYDELIDRRLKSWIGPEHGLEWFKSTEGGLLVWGAKPEERYPGPFWNGRLHLYYEFMINAGKEVKEVTDQLGLDWDTSDYQAIPEWKPCPAFVHRDSNFDLFVVNFKVPIQIHGIGRFNPVLRQLVTSHRLDTFIMNTETAKRKGISDGDEMVIETVNGKKNKGFVTVSERIHPEVIGTMQHRLSGGGDFNSLLSLDKETMDFVGCAVDACQLVKTYKA